MTNNVINFPKASKSRPPQSVEEFRESILDHKASYANEIVDHYAQQLANKIGMHGFQIDNEQRWKSQWQRQEWQRKDNAGSFECEAFDKGN